MEGPGTDAWEAAWRAGRARYGPLDLPLPDFRAAVEGRAAPPASDSPPERDGGDLFLAAAADRGAAGAWEALSKAFRPRLLGLLSRKGAPRALAEEIVDDLPGHLCVAPAGGPARTRLGTFDGRGTLFGWLAVVALRSLADRLRVRAGDPASVPFGVGGAPGDLFTTTSGTGLTPADAGQGPPSLAAAEERRARFEAALASALETLTVKERLALLFRFRDGLAGREIARLLRVTESRVSHLLRTGTERLREFVGRRLKETPPTARDHAAWMDLEEAVRRALSSPAASAGLPSGGADANDDG